MNVVIFLNSLSLGGTEKAACFWAALLAGRANNSVQMVALLDGPRRSDPERFDVSVHVLPESGIRISTSDKVTELAGAVASASVIHAHAPGVPHPGDVLGEALRVLGRKIPVVQTNIFGKLENPKEEAWTDFRLFISWASCVQAARRAGRKLNLDFFRRQSVAVYPVEDPFKVKCESGNLKPEKDFLVAEALQLRVALGLQPEHVLFGRFSRPEPNKWSPLALDAFIAALRENQNIRLLLREPPQEVAHAIRVSGFKSQVFILPATSDPHELALSQVACDAILHTSSIGESFGYGLAEPMALGKPVITSSVPWHDQAQIELVRHGECGHIASTVPSMKAAILRMADDSAWRVACGKAARKHILSVADPEDSVDRVELAMRCAIEGRDNPLAEQDVEKAIKTAEYLDKHQWGHSLDETLCLRSNDTKVRFLRWQRQLRNRLRLR